MILGVMSTTSQAEDPIQVSPPAVKAPAKPAAEKKKVVMTYLRTGGFIGYHDDLAVYADFTFERKGRRLRPKQARTGDLNANQQAVLKKLLATFGKVQWSRRPPPNVADGISEAITIDGTGKKTTLSPKDPELRQMQKLASEILRGVK